MVRHALETLTFNCQDAITRLDTAVLKCWSVNKNRFDKDTVVLPSRAVATDNGDANAVRICFLENKFEDDWLTRVVLWRK